MTEKEFIKNYLIFNILSYIGIENRKFFIKENKKSEIAKNPEAMQNLVNDFQEVISWFSNFRKNKEARSEKK